MITIRHCRQTAKEAYKPKYEWPVIERKEQPKPAAPLKREPMVISERGNALIKQIMAEYDLTREQLLSSSRAKPIVTARRHLMTLMHVKLGWNACRIAHFMGIDRTTVSHHIGLRRSSRVKYGTFIMP
jgi:hypothetical protein